VAALVDTNILVYRFDPRFPLKQELATELLRRGIEDESIVLPYQALVEFVAATTRPISGQASLLTKQEAHREVEDLLAQFQVIYPYSVRSRLAARRRNSSLTEVADSFRKSLDSHGVGTPLPTRRASSCAE
jgi:predicted nucleic acid-binding protein